MTALILNRQSKIRVPLRELSRFVDILSRRLRLGDAEFTILLTGDRRIRSWNKHYRHKDKPTDVLSFPVVEEYRYSAAAEDCNRGDIAISVESALRQARERGHSLERELKILVLHGLLHLLGYNHETDQGQMRRKERELQKELLPLSARRRLKTFSPPGRRTEKFYQSL